MEKRKYLGNMNRNYIKTFKSKVIRINDDDIKGYVSFSKIEEVYRPFMAGETCLYDTDYSEIGFLPDNENWMLWAMYDNNDDIIEWYFDVTKKNTLDEEGKPYCDDLYLDIALMPNGEILILDEDEIKDALNKRMITQDEYDMAYSVMDKLIRNKIIDVVYMETLCSRLRLLFF